MPQPAAPVAAKASVVLIKPGSATAALTEQTILRDTTPLFLPTEYNAAVKEPPPRGSGKTFLDNETLKLSFGEAGLNLTDKLPPHVVMNGKLASQAKPEDVLANEITGPGVLGFGRVESQVAPLEPRGGFIEVIAVGSGQQLIGESLPLTATPPTGKEWRPMEFLGVIDAAGLVAPLLLREGSRVEEVDAHFRNYITQTFGIGARLPPGFYRVVVGP